MLHLFPELQCTYLCEGIVDIVERIFEYVPLLQPPASSFEEVAAFIILVRLIFLLELSPGSFSLGRRHLRIRIYQVLEFIHKHSVWHELDSASHVSILVFFGVFPEEKLHPRIGYEFHAHGMDLAAFVCREIYLRNIYPS